MQRELGGQVVKTLMKELSSECVSRVEPCHSLMSSRAPVSEGTSCVMIQTPPSLERPKDPVSHVDSWTLMRSTKMGPRLSFVPLSQNFR